MMLPINHAIALLMRSLMVGGRRPSLRPVKLDGRTYNRYSGAHLRALRRRNGVGSPRQRRGAA